MWLLPAAVCIVGASAALRAGGMLGVAAAILIGGYGIICAILAHGDARRFEQLLVEDHRRRCEGRCACGPRVRRLASMEAA